MKAKHFVILGLFVLGLGAIVGFTVVNQQKNVVAVQTGKVVKQDIASVVTASLVGLIRQRRGDTGLCGGRAETTSARAKIARGSNDCRIHS